MRIRIVFLNSGQIIKTFDREAHDPAAAKALAEQIGRDSGIAHEEEKILIERKCILDLFDGEGKAVEKLESSALDEADAKQIAQKWATACGKTFATAQVAWK